MNRLKLIPWAVGGCLLVGSLAGAKLLQSPEGTGSAPPANGKKGPADSLVQVGTVDTETRPVGYLLPSHLPAATVAEVLVKEGEAVRAGQVLVRFDAEMLGKDLARAEAAHAAALWQQKQAQTAVDTYTLIDEAKLAMEAAETGLKTARDVRDATARGIDDANKLSRPSTLTSAELDRLRREDPRMIAAEGNVTLAEQNVKAKRLDQTKAESGKTRLEETVKTAVAGVAVAAADVDKAKTAIARCELTAVSAGRAERVDAAAGQVLGPTSRTPLVLVVPDGPRIVRVEVVPDFAQKLHDQLGKPVRIADEQVPGHTYKGTVDRIGTAFLPRRSAGPDLLAGKPTTVLEVVVRVADEEMNEQPGRPPLRVGQPVRVHFQ